MLETAANWMAIAIGNARQRAELERRVQESEAIANIGRALDGTLELEQVLHLITDTARKIIPNVDWATIHLLEGNPERLYRVATVGLELEPDRYVLNPGQGIAGRVVIENARLFEAQLRARQESERQQQHLPTLARRLTDEIMESLRLLAHDLRPPRLDAFGLDATLAGLCQEFGNRIQIPIEDRGIDTSILPHWMLLPLYRFVQEALTNVAKHANASQAEVVLEINGGLLQLTVADDGKGFDASEQGSIAGNEGGIGQTNMSERIELIGGQLQVTSAPGRGTRLVACLPHLHLAPR